MKRITIKDLAKELGLNVSTISRALSDHPNVSKVTKEKVVALAKKLKYKPNMLAKNFRNSETKLVAMVIHDIDMFFQPALIRGATDILDSKGYHIVLFNSKGSLEKEIENIQKCEAYSVDGILLCISAETLNLNHLADLVDIDLPIVQFDRIITKSIIPSVTIDDHNAAFNGTNMLIKDGLKEIYGFFGSPHLDLSKARAQGFQDALIAKGINVEGKTFYAKDTNETIIAAEKLLKSNLKFPIGIFCNTDTMLIDVYKVLNENGISIPDQVNLSCISDGVTPKMLKIDIPYVEHSGYNVGHEAGALLAEMLETKAKYSEVKSKVVPTSNFN